MQDSNSQKYLVYFFLYLAVVCELLIIIVERDDAEAHLLRQQRRTTELLRSVVFELMRTRPVAVTTGTSLMKVGETRTFTFTVTGLGEKDAINRAPGIGVWHNGARIDSLHGGDMIRELQSRQGDSLRRFSFAWRAPAVGVYEFRGSASTDHVSLQADGLMKIGNLELPRAKVAEIIGSDPGTDEIVRSAIAVEVVAPPDRLTITAPDLVTTAGFETSTTIQVHGTSPYKARVAPDIGRIASGDGGGPVWRHTFPRPGRYRVRLDATDSRGEAGISAAQGAFTVDVLEPAPRRAMPAQVFAYETAEFDISVAGLEEMDRYAWTVSQDGVERSRGTGVRIAYKPDAKGTCTIRATYASKPYPVKGHGSSVFVIPVADPLVHVLSATFQKHGEYPITHKFQLRVARYGRRISEYCKAVPPSEIRIDAEDVDGNDLLDGDPRYDAQTGATEVTFYLKGRVSKDGTDAVIRLRIGTLTETWPISVYRE
jgi:hypothetical protein